MIDKEKEIWNFLMGVVAFEPVKYHDIKSFFKNYEIFFEMFVQMHTKENLKIVRDFCDESLKGNRTDEELNAIWYNSGSPWRFTGPGARYLFKIVSDACAKQIEKLRQIR